jgi:hypothetical protein
VKIPFLNVDMQHPPGRTRPKVAHEQTKQPGGNRNFGDLKLWSFLRVLSDSSGIEAREVRWLRSILKSGKASFLLNYI